jgi:hypothetical protein
MQETKIQHINVAFIREVAGTTYDQALYIPLRVQQEDF